MADNPYEILGTNPSDSPEAIQKAYRRLAKKLHPDLNPGNRESEEQFKRVAAAYSLLSDPEKRARFDRGEEIDVSAARGPQRPFYRDFAGGGSDHDPYATDAGFADFAASDDVLAAMFRRGARTHLRVPGADVHYRLPLEFLEAVNGATKRITMPDGSNLELAVPPGAREGQTLRLRGKGQPGIDGGPPGDALVGIEVRPHRFLTREGDDIRLDIPISLSEAVLGGRVMVPTPTGPVAMTVPKGSSSGRVLRLRGKGAVRPDGGRGDEYVSLRIVLPETEDPELEAFVRDWAAGRSHNPRQGMEA